MRTAVSRLDKRVAVSLREIEQSDFILVIGADPEQEAPLLSLTLRQAFRKGASIVVIDPRPVFLPLTFEHLSVTPDDPGSLPGHSDQGDRHPPGRWKNRGRGLSIL